MQYSFRIGDRKTSLRQQVRELADDGAARIEALLFAAAVLGDTASAAAEARDLIVDVRGTDGELRVTVQIHFSGDFQPSSEDEFPMEGEGHPS